MKHLLILPILLLISTCGASTSNPTCDIAGTKLTHVVVASKPATQGVEYHIPIAINGTNMEAIADTGSSNLIVSRSDFIPSGPSLGNYSIRYGSGAATLEAHADSVSLKCGPAVNNFIYGSIQPGSSQNTTLMGLAYNDIERHISGTQPEQTFFEQLASNPQNKISDEFSMLLCGVGNNNSRIIFGGTGTTPIGSFQYVSLTEKSYYVINAGAVKIDGAQMGANFLTNSSQRTIVDSGTTLNLVPQDVYDAIVANPKIAPFVSTPGANINCPDTSGMPDITVDLDNFVTLTIKPSTYFKKLDNGQCFFGFSPKSGALNILGQVAMENYKIHFDRKNSQIGFAANTECNN
jgi:hypothetical protein